MCSASWGTKRHASLRTSRQGAKQASATPSPFGCVGSRYYLLVPLWRKPPTAHATLCNGGVLLFQGGAPCLNRPTFESMRLSACAWRQTVCNWWARFIVRLCSGISFGWQGYGAPRRNGVRARIPRHEFHETGLPSPRADFATAASNAPALGCRSQ